MVKIEKCNEESTLSDKIKGKEFSSKSRSKSNRSQSKEKINEEREEGELEDEEDESYHFDDGFGEDLMGDEKDRLRLSSMDEKERESELRKRFDRREEMKLKFMNERKLRAEKKKEKRTNDVKNTTHEKDKHDKNQSREQREEESNPVKEPSNATENDEKKGGKEKTRSRSTSSSSSSERSRSRNRRYRSYTRSSSRSRSSGRNYKGIIIKDFRRGRRGKYLSYNRFQRGRRPYRRGPYLSHHSYRIRNCSRSRTRSRSQSRSKSISRSRSKSPVLNRKQSPHVTNITSNKGSLEKSNSSAKRSPNVENKASLNPADIKRSQKQAHQSFLAMLEEKQKRSRMIPIEPSKSDKQEPNSQRQHGFVNTFNTVGTPESQTKNTLSFDLENDGWKVIDDAENDSTRQKIYDDQNKIDFRYENEPKGRSRREVASEVVIVERNDNIEETINEKTKKDSSSSESTSSENEKDDYAKEKQKKKSKKKKKDKSKRNRKEESSPSLDDTKEKKKSKKKKRRKSDESSSESEEDGVDTAESQEELDRSPSRESENQDQDYKKKEKSRKKKRKSESSSESESDEKVKKKKKKEKKKTKKKRSKRRRRDDSTSEDSESSESDQKKKRKSKKRLKKKSKSRKAKKHKKERSHKDSSEISEEEEMFKEREWPYAMIKYTQAKPKLQFCENPDSFNNEISHEISQNIGQFVNPNTSCSREGSLEKKDSWPTGLEVGSIKEENDILTPSEKRALEKLKKQQQKEIEKDQAAKFREEIKRLPLSSYYTTKKTCESPLIIKDEKDEQTSIKENKSENKPPIHKVSKSKEDNGKYEDTDETKKLTAKELLEKVRKKKENEKSEQKKLSSKYPVIGKLKKSKKDSVEDDDSGKPPVYPPGYTMDADYNWYVPNYMQMYGLDAYSAAYYAQYMMLTGGKYDSSEISAWLNSRGYTVDHLNLPGPSQDNGSQNREGVMDLRDNMENEAMDIDTRDSFNCKIESVKSEGISEEIGGSQEKVNEIEVIVPRTPLSANEALIESNGCSVSPPPPPPPRPQMTELTGNAVIRLPNGEKLPPGTKHIIVHHYPSSHPFSDNFVAHIHKQFSQSCAEDVNFKTQASTRIYS